MDDTRESTDLKTQPANVDADFFKEALRRRQISQRRLAKHLGISPAAVTTLLQGTRRMQITEAASIAALLGLHVSEVLERAGVRTPREAQCAVVYVADAGGDLTPRPERTYVPAPLAGDETSVAVRCEAPMAPRFGWVYYFSPRTTVDVSAHGRMCVCQTKDGRRMIAFCVPGFDGKTFVLQRENGAVENAELISASPISWIKLLIS